MAKKEATTSVDQAKELGEGAIKASPVDKATDAVMGIFTSVLKVRDLRSAAVVLHEARELHDGNKTTQARELAMQVFDRLKRVGTDTDDLPERQVVRKLVEDGKFAELAKMIKNQQRKMETDPREADRIRKASEKAAETQKSLIELNRERTRIEEMPKTDAAANEVKLMPGKAAEKLSSEARELALMEKELSEGVDRELSELVRNLGEKMKASDRKEFESDWATFQADLKLVSRAELSLSDVVTTRETLKKMWQERMSEGEDIIEKIRDRARDDEEHGGRKLSSGEKIVKQFVDKRGIAIAVVGRTKELTKVLDTVEGKLKLGIPFEDICKNMNPTEIGVVRNWLRSIGKRKGEVGYDPIISEISEEILRSPEGRRVLVRFMENVEVGYEEQRWSAAENEAKEWGVRAENMRERVLMGEPIIRDELGRPIHGLEAGKAGFSRSGAEFLETMGGESAYVQRWLEAKSVEDYAEAAIKRQSLYRAEMMNVNFKALIDDETVPDKFKKYLDVESFEKGQVARLKAEYRNEPDSKKREEYLKEFQALWLQEMLYEQRMIAYEGVFQGAHQDARVTRYNTLMSIMDISTSLKGYAKFKAQMFGAVDRQQNSYLDEEGLNSMVDMWVSQGPDFRLEHMLKQYRENMYVLDGKGERVKVGDISVYDVVHKLKMRVENADEREKLGLSGNISRHYGTMLEKYTDDDKRGAARKVIFLSLMKDLGVNVDGLNGSQSDYLVSRYQSYLDEAINYMWVHKELHQAIGNASLDPNKYQLPQALPEMLYKADPFLVMDYFRIYSVGGTSKDAFVFGDSGMRDHITMAPSDYANHLLYAETTSQGAPGIREAFFGNKRDGNTDRYVGWFAKTMKESIYHNGYYDKSHPVSMSKRIGNGEEFKSGTRRPDAEVIDRLAATNPPEGMVEAIEWGTPDNPGVFAKIVVDQKLVAKLTSSELNPQQKWDLFVKRYGEDYYNASAGNAKREDHKKKYGLGSHFTWYKAYLAWQLSPVNNAKAIEAFQPASAVNAGIVPYLAENFLQYQSWANERLGKKWIGGGSTERVKRDEKNQIQFDTSYGMMGLGDSEWPGLAHEKLENDTGLFDPIPHGSVNEASGIAGYQDELAMKNLAEDLMRAGLLHEKAYRHWYYKHFVKSFAWADKKGALLNLWGWLTLDIPFEYMGNVWFGIPGHMLRGALWEPTKKQWEKTWKYIVG